MDISREDMNFVYICPHCGKPLNQIEEKAEDGTSLISIDWKCPSCGKFTIDFTKIGIYAL